MRFNGDQMKTTFLLAATFVTFLVGCGSDRPRTIPVEGRVTLGGESWPAEGTLYFTPTKAGDGHSLKPGTAKFDKSGNFVVGSWKSDDGLVPGTYGVRVECWKVPPTVDGPPEVSYVDSRYFNASTNNLTVEVTEEGGPVSLKWDIQPARN